MSRLQDLRRLGLFLFARLRFAALAAVCLLAAVGAERPAFALDVIGNINANTTWKKSDSPIRLTGDVTVQSHVVLTIEPGTVIEAAATDSLGSGVDTTKVELIVKGGLTAEGAESDHIIIRGATAGVTGWYGISIEPGAKPSSLTFAEVSDALIGIYARTTSTLVLSDLKVASCSTGLRWQASPGPTLTRVAVRSVATNGIMIGDDGTSGATATLSEVSVQGAGTGLKLSTRVTAAVTRSSFTYSTFGVDTDAGSALTLTNSVVAVNSQVGLQLYQTGSNVFKIINNTIDRNNSMMGMLGSPGQGIKVAAVSDASKFIIRNNNVTSHGTYGISVAGATSPSIDHNNVWGNATNYSAGTSGGIGAISTNPLYRNGGAGMSFSHLGYPNNDSWSFTCTDAKATQMYAVFSSFGTESGPDRLVLSDATGTMSQTLSGSLGSFASQVFTGSSLNFRFTSDGSVTGTGFAGTCVGLSLNYRLQSSSPVIDVGNNLDAPAMDLDGVGRPVDGDMDGTATVDIGAFEWHTNQAPVAQPGPEQLVLVSTTVNFDGRSSFDPDGMVAGYSWDFGDGSAAVTTAVATHKYTALGVYTVKLTVTDDQGSTGSASVKITVVDNLPPKANPGPDQKVAPGDTVSFDGGGSIDPDGTIVAYDWLFGDGTPKGSGRTVTHIYAAAGTYRAMLTVTDNKGATGTGSATVTVGDGGHADMAMGMSVDMAMGMSTDMAMGMSGDLGSGADMKMSTDLAVGMGADLAAGMNADMAKGMEGDVDLSVKKDGGTGGPGRSDDVTGCGCRVAGAASTSSPGYLVLGLTLALITLGRRRRRGSAALLT